MRISRLEWIPLLVLALLLAFLPLLLSQGIKYSLVSELERRGMTGIAVEKLWLNPYTGVASIDALNFSKGDEHYHITGLELDVGLLELLERKVRVSGIRLVSARVVIQQDADGHLLINNISLGSDTTLEIVEDVVEEEPEDSTATWQFALDNLGVEDVQVLVELPDLLADVSVEKIAIARLDTSEQHSADVEVRLTLNRLQLPAAQLESATAVTLNTALVLARQGTSDWLLSADSKLKLADLNLTTPEARVKLPTMGLQLDSAAAYGKALWTLTAKADTRLQGLHVTAADTDLQLPDTRVQLTLDGKTAGSQQDLKAQTQITLRDLVTTVPDARVGLPKLVLNLDATAKGAGDNWDIAGKSSATLSELDVVTPQVAVTLAKTGLQLDAKARVGEPLDYQASLTVAASDAAVQDGESKAALLNLQQLDLATAIRHGDNGDVVNVEQLLLTGLNLLLSKDQPTLLSDAVLQVDGVRVQVPGEGQPLDVVVERVALPQATVRFVRDAEGKLPQLATVLKESAAGGDASAVEKGSDKNAQPGQSAPEGAGTSAPVGDSEADADSGLAPVLIRHLAIGPEVVIHVSDAGIKPTFKEKLQFQQLAIDNLSLQDEELPAELSLQLNLSHDAALKVDGSFNALAPKADLQVSLKEYQLLGLTGYSEQYTGYALESGVFSLTSAIKVVANQLDTKNEAVINHIRLRPEHSDTAERFAHSLTMPFDQALDLLRDSKNQIRLEVPVTGPLNDPNVDLQQVINKALGGAVKKASMMVLKAMLQPYGTLISVVQMAGEKMAQITLAPVEFAAGQAELSEMAKDYAGKLADMINQREALTLRMCGVANREDFDALLAASGIEAATLEARAEQEQLQREALNALADSRTEALRQHLQHELGVKSSQLVVCLPRYSSKAKAVSGVELSF